MSYIARKISYFYFFALISNQVFAIDCSAIWPSKDTMLLRSLIQESLRNEHKLILEPRIYNINQSISIPNRTVIDGAGAVIFGDLCNNEGAILVVNSSSDIVLENINLQSNGVFNPQPFNSPYAVKKMLNAVGFTNTTVGVFVFGNSRNIKIAKNKISGVETGVKVLSVNKSMPKNITITKNIITSVGKTGIYVLNANNILIESNTISDVYGNYVSGIPPKVLKAKFADGVYIGATSNAQVIYNNISDVRRIGVVLDGVYSNDVDLGRVNRDIAILKNTIKSVKECSDTENNAGIWVEAGFTKSNPTRYFTRNVIIESNIINNKGIKACVNEQYGIFSAGNQVVIKNNKITNFNTYGIYCNHGEVLLGGNWLDDNKINIYRQKDDKTLQGCNDNEK